MNAPIIPPRRMYLGCTWKSFLKLLFLSEMNQTHRLVISAESCTKLTETHMLVSFVSSVLKTPCILINAPDKMAIRIQIIASPNFIDILYFTAYIR
jgi:NADPH-dependent 7-cyano-7-deazaguanine reductase QueF